MFGTLGFSELIIILVIMLIIFGAGRLPQIGEGVGKALKGFKKEVHDVPPPVEPNVQAGSPEGQPAASQIPGAEQPPTPPASETATAQPYQPGPEATPGTTAALAYSGVRPEPVQPAQPHTQPQATQQQDPVQSEHQVHQPMTMEQRAASPVPTSQAQYPALPPSAKPTGATKRPSAVVNKEAVARVQAQQAAMKAKAAQSAAPSSEDMQSLGEGLGSTLRTFRQAAADVRNSIDPEMRTIQAELESAEKEVQESIEAAKQPPLPKTPPAGS